MEVLQTSALPLGYGAKPKEGRWTAVHRIAPLRAGNGTRTRDPNLGKVVLYQLSYSRMGPGGSVDTYPPGLPAVPVSTPPRTHDSS